MKKFSIVPEVIMSLALLAMVVLMFVPDRPMIAQHKRSGVKLTATAGTVTVQWTDTSAGPGVGFFIYKGTTSGGESGTPLNSSPVDVGQSCLTTSAYCAYNDTPTPGVQACYTVAANNSSGTSAKASPDACVTVPIPIPAVPVLGPPIVN